VLEEHDPVHFMPPPPPHAAEEITHGAPEEAHAGGDAAAHDGHHNNHAYNALLFLFVMLAIGAFCRTVLAGTKVPYTVALMLIGLAIGGVSYACDLGYLSNSIDQWQSIDPHLLLFAFLPGLIFESAFSLEWHTLRKCISQVTLLATVGVVIGQVLIGAFVVLVFPYGWSWQFGLMVGATLCVTDPVAVVALLKELGASKRLSTVIEGESLFNDGTGIVLFTLFVEIAKGTSYTAGEIVLFFLQVPLGGVAVGIAFALGTLFWLSRVYNDSMVDISLTLTSCYLTFFVAEEVCGCSGILAVVALGAYMGAVGKPYFQVRKETEESLHHFWEMCAYCTNTAIFILAGVIIGRRLCEESAYFQWQDAGWLLLLYVYVNVARAITVALLYPVLKRLGYGLDPPNAAVVVWGGLRGAVSLALALVVSLETEFDHKDRAIVLLHVGGIVILTLCVNGSTTAWILHLVGLDSGSTNMHKVLSDVRQELTDMTMTSYLELFYDDLLGGASYDVVQGYVGAMGKAPGDKSTETVHKRETVLARMKSTFKRLVSNTSIEESLPQNVLSRKESKAKIHTKEEVVMDVRNRFLQTVMQEYTTLLESGHIDIGTNLRLKDSVNVAMDRTSEPLCDWDELSRHFSEPKLWVGLKLVPLPLVVKNFINMHTTTRLLAANLQASVAFVTAHRIAGKHVGEAFETKAGRQVMEESDQMCERALTYVYDLKMSFPELASNVKTMEVIRHLLIKQLEFLHAAAHTGVLESGEVSNLVTDVEQQLKKFLSDPPIPKGHDNKDLIESIPLVASLSATDPTLHQAVVAAAERVVFQAGKVICKRGSQEDKVYLLGRGVITIGVPSKEAADKSVSGSRSARLSIAHRASSSGAGVTKLRVGSRSHPAGWALGLPQVLFRNEEEESETACPAFEVVADTLVVAFALPGELVRNIVLKKEAEGLLLWRACVGMLLETHLRNDVTFAVTTNMQRDLAQGGEMIPLPPVIEEDPDHVLVLLQGTVHSDVWGDINSPAILSHVLSSATLEALGGVAFLEDGKMKVQNSTENAHASRMDTLAEGEPDAAKNDASSGPVAAAKIFKRKSHGLYMKVKLPSADTAPSKGSVIDPRVTTRRLWSINAAPVLSPDSIDEVSEFDAGSVEPVSGTSPTRPAEHRRRPASSQRPMKPRSSMSRYSALGAELNETVQARASTYSPEVLKQFLQAARN